MIRLGLWFGLGLEINFFYKYEIVFFEVDYYLIMILFENLK